MESDEDVGVLILVMRKCVSIES